MKKKIKTKFLFHFDWERVNSIQNQIKADSRVNVITRANVARCNILP